MALLSKKIVTLNFITQIYVLHQVNIVLSELNQSASQQSEAKIP